MRKDQTSVIVVLALLVLNAAPDRARAQAKGPAFDCAKAQGEVQQLVCKDEGLAALDRKLDEVYKAARAKATNEVPPVLVAEQRGWVKGRDECWKAKTGGPSFLTATWQATNVRECVEGNYRIRISELQAKYGLVASKGPVFFACENNPANELVATFFETDPPTARLERGDQTVTAWLVPAGSGSRYEGRNVEFSTKGQDATATWLGAELKCRSSQPENGAWGIDLTAMDKSVELGDDFFRYVNGKWLERTEIPADKLEAGGLMALQDKALEETRVILEEAAADTKAARGSDARKMGDWYASFMDEAAIEAAGFAPIRPELDAIASVTTRQQLADLHAHRIREGDRRVVVAREGLQY